MSFDPKIVSELPEGSPFIENDFLKELNIQNFPLNIRKLYRFCKGGDDNLQSMRREQLFVQMLEGLHKDEAKVVIDTKTKSYIEPIKDFPAVVKEAFNWNDDYKDRMYKYNTVFFRESKMQNQGRGCEDGNLDFIVTIPPHNLAMYFG